jgi:hypothetical protein
MESGVKPEEVPVPALDLKLGLLVPFGGGLKG